MTVEKNENLDDFVDSEFEDSDGEDYHDYECVSLNPDKWEETENTLRSPEQWEWGTGAGWYHRQYSTDIAASFYTETTKENLTYLKTVGELVMEVKSSNESYVDAKKLAFLQALRNLFWLPHTAAIVLHPQIALFIDISVDKGFIRRSIKQYSLIPAYGVGNRYAKRDIDPLAFKDLFRDLTLYVWNTFYEGQYYQKKNNSKN